MALADGDPARDGDHWFRVATRSDQIKAGRPHHGAFLGTAISKPLAEDKRAWDRELSGRLRSQAGALGDCIAHAQKYCEELTKRGGGTKTFSGFIFAKVDELRLTYENTVRAEVYFTPIKDGDQAHADLTFTGWNIEMRPELDKFTMWLSDRLYAFQYDPSAPEGARGQLDFFPAATDIRTLTERASDALSAVIEKLTPG